MDMEVSGLLATLASLLLAAVLLRQSLCVHPTDKQAIARVATAAPQNCHDVQLPSKHGVPSDTEGFVFGATEVVRVDHEPQQTRK